MFSNKIRSNSDLYIKHSTKNISVDDLRKSNGIIINDKMIESIKKMVLLGKSVDEVAFFYNVPILVVNKILDSL